jgi:dolichol kinase
MVFYKFNLSLQGSTIIGFVWFLEFIGFVEFVESIEPIAFVESFHFFFPLLHSNAMSRRKPRIGGLSTQSVRYSFVILFFLNPPEPSALTANLDFFFTIR